jgi:predicted phosphodiesterase
LIGPQPDEVLTTLRQRQIPTVMGNTDAWIFELSSDSPTTVRLATWGNSQISEENRTFARSFQPTIDIALPRGRTLLACHATPHNFDDILLLATPAAEASELLSGNSAELIAGGHTHIPFLRQIDQHRFVNPGSAGLPGIGAAIPELPPNHTVDWADYAILDVTEQSVAIAFQRIPVDVPAILATARAAGMPEFEWWARLWKTVD